MQVVTASAMSISHFCLLNTPPVWTPPTSGLIRHTNTRYTLSFFILKYLNTIYSRKTSIIRFVSRRIYHVTYRPAALGVKRAKRANASSFFFFPGETETMARSKVPELGAFYWGYILLSTQVNHAHWAAWGAHPLLTPAQHRLNTGSGRAQISSVSREWAPNRKGKAFNASRNSKIYVIQHKIEGNWTKRTNMDSQPNAEQDPFI